MNNSHALLIIDAQYDFCNPEGALYVPGAQEDIKRLSTFIEKNSQKIAHICLTLDSHPVHDISHPLFWRDAAGNPPRPFTQITLKEVKEGKWTPVSNLHETLDYLSALEAQGEFPHFIWPEHCLNGSKGAAIDETLFDAVRKWSATTGKEYQTVTKGTYPLTEHFGIFQAQIPTNDHPETLLNQTLLDSLNEYQYLYLAGQAKSHCVATSLKQMMDYAPDLAQKVIVLEDCMSNVTGMAHLGEPIYERAKQLGIRFEKGALLQL